MQRFSPVIGLLALLVGVAPSRAQTVGPPPPPGRLIDIGGWRMHINCSGERRAGQPLVVLDAGSSDSSVEWSLVQPEVAKFVRVCAYDRSGSGWSELGPVPHTNQQIVAELGALLQASGEPAPYVMVGHSMGGRYVRLFANARPNDVVGMVLVDANHEDDLLFINGQLRREWETATGQSVPLPRLTMPLKLEDVPAMIRAQVEAIARQNAARALDPPFNKLPPAAQQARQWMQAQPTWMLANNSPFGAEEVAQMKKARESAPQPLGDLPLVVITRGEAATGQQAAEREESRKGNQADLATLSRQGKQVIAARSGHHIQIDEPDVVAAAIKDVVALAESRAR